MTTFAPNFTPRVRVKYVAAGVEHTIQMRSPRGSSSAVTEGKKEIISDMFDALASVLAADFAFIACDYALTDSDVWFPVALPTAVTGLKLVADYSLQQKVTSTGFVGRAPDSRASIFMYGVWWDDGDGTPRDNGRCSVLESAQIGTIVGYLTANAKAGSGADAVFHQYANIKVNDHLLKLVRRGSIT